MLLFGQGSNLFFVVFFDISFIRIELLVLVPRLQLRVAQQLLQTGDVFLLFVSSSHLIIQTTA
jgi:hypothetical protein